MFNSPSPFPNPPRSQICYFNALLQCMLAAVQKKLLIASSQAPINLYTLKDMRKRLAAKKVDFQFSGQQCAGEAYSMMQTAYEDFPSFANLFFYTSTTIITCQKCATKITVNEKNNIILIENQEKALRQLFLHEEEIEYRCSSCSCSSASKRTTLKNPPKIIVCQVKINNEKNRVVFPAGISTKTAKWEAAGFIHHSSFAGNDSGHYRACVNIKKNWWIADDEEIKQGTLSRDSICMAFYRML